MNALKAVSNQSGQMTIEMVLMFTLLMGVVVFSTGYIRDNAIVASLVEGPWSAVQGMIEDGVWKPAGASKQFHPSTADRRRSYEGENAP
jgi:hypothetical protein